MRYLFRQAHEVASTNADALAALGEKKAHANLKHAPRPEDFPVYHMTSGGRLWRWSCGWQEFDKNGKLVGSPIGHLQFRKFKLAKKTGDREKDAWIKMSRPEGPWRRHIDCILNHELFGNGIVTWTDGVHALFKFHTKDGVEKQVEVMFNTLVEIKPITVRKAPSGKPVNKSDKGAKLSLLTLDLL